MTTSAEIDPGILATVLIAGDAGLRCGEIVALEVRDIDFTPGWIVVCHQERRGKLTTPKSGTRRVPMRSRTNRAPGCCFEPTAGLVAENVLDNWLERAQVAAYVGTRKSHRRASGQGLHKLRHRFGIMVVRVMDVRRVQTLMGHQHLITTERYLHVDDQGLTAGIRALAG